MSQNQSAQTHLLEVQTLLLNEVKQFLSVLEPTLEEFLELFDLKRKALTDADSNTLIKLSVLEEEMVGRMNGQLESRQRILNEARREGLPAGSIDELAMAIGGDERHLLKKRIAEARIKSERIRRESWMHWIVSQRSLHHCGELLELIAYCGKKAPTYTCEPDRKTSGSALLDASI